MEDSCVQHFRSYILLGQYRLLFDTNNSEGDKSTSVFDKVTHGLTKDKKQIIMYHIYEQEYIELM